MFNDYFGYVGKPEIIGKAEVSKIKSGERQLERDGRQYYLEESGRKALINDLNKYILEKISDKYALCDKLRDLILSDNMDNRDRERLLSSYPKDDEGISAFLADVIIFSLNRPVKKGAVSPFMSERINIPAVASCKYFCGREKELQALSEMLETQDKIFIKGIGGIGKSELVKKYIKVNKGKYTNILFLTYSESLMNTIAGIPFKADSKEATVDELYSAHLEFLRFMREDTLIVIDNFDIIPDTDSKFNDIAELNCKIIFSTRNDVGIDYNIFELNEMDKAALFEMADNLKVANIDRETLSRIFDGVYNHTLACELILRLLSKSAYTPDEILNMVLTDHVALNVKDKIRKNESATYSEHIHRLFRMFALSKEQQDIMRLLSLIPHLGISDSYFRKLTGVSDMNVINELDEIGLVIYDNHTIQVHPLIGEAAAADFTPDTENCRTFMNSLISEFQHHFDDPVNCVRQIFVLEISDRIVEFSVKSNTEYYFFFLINACPYAETFEDEKRMSLYIAEMEKYLSSIEDKLSVAVYYMCKASYQKIFHNDNAGAIKQLRKALKYVPDVMDGKREYSQREIALCFNINNNLGVFCLDNHENYAAEKYIYKAKEICESFKVNYSDFPTLVENLIRSSGLNRKE